MRQTRDPAFPIVPVILPETTTDLPFDFLRVLTRIDFSHVTRVLDAPDVLQQLLTAIRGGGTAAEGALEAICPYRGLDAFREEDSTFFFGRGSMLLPKRGSMARPWRHRPSRPSRRSWSRNAARTSCAITSLSGQATSAG